ncbi:MAG TPA: hypothetical protein VL944_03330 [Candidatus Acidoferrum sp.]|nr:hypothetical protein [Candidatus Acidoferrum sp.]
MSKNINKTGRGSEETIEDTAVVKSPDKEIVAILLERCKTPEEVMKLAKMLRHKGGWREEFVLYGYAADKFSANRGGFILAQQGMATLRKLQSFTEMERAGMLRSPTREELLNIGANL